MAQTDDYATLLVQGYFLTPNDVLVGESGGLLVLYRYVSELESAEYLGGFVTWETEYGVLLVDPFKYYRVLDQ